MLSVPFWLNVCGSRNRARHFGIPCSQGLLRFREALFGGPHYVGALPLCFPHPRVSSWHPGVLRRKGKCLYRLGEASNPGPCIVSANLSSLTQGWADLAALRWDIALVQEARVSLGSSILGDIRRAGCQVILSAPDHDGNSLLAIIIRCGSVSPIPAVLGARLMGVVWYSGGGYPMRLYNVYGNAHGSSHSLLDASTLCREALLDAEGSGRVPSLIGGDFNMEFEQLHCLYSLVASEWSDIGTEPTSICSRSTCPRRIDLLLANRAFSAIVEGYSLAWDTGLPSHAVQFLSLSGVPPPLFPAWQSPAPLPPPVLPISPEEAWRSVPPDLLARTRALALSNQVQEAWLFCLEKHYYAQSGEFVPLAARRGTVLLKRESAKPTPGGDAVSAALDKSLRRWRRLRELGKGWATGVLPHRFNLILKALVRTETLASPWRPRLLALSTQAQLDVLLAEAELEVSTSIAAHRQHRRDRWYEWCNDPTQTARVYRYIRQGATPITYPPVGDSRAQPGKATQLAEVDAWWWDLWAPPVRALQ